MIRLKNILKESPDMVEVFDDLDGYVTLSWSDKESNPFSILNGKIFYGEGGSMHMHLVDDLKTMADMVKVMGLSNNISRKDLNILTSQAKYRPIHGRIFWEPQQVISFWQYPKNKFGLIRVLKLIDSVAYNSIDYDAILVDMPDSTKLFVDEYRYKGNNKDPRVSHILPPHLREKSNMMIKMRDLIGEVRVHTSDYSTTLRHIIDELSDKTFVESTGASDIDTYKNVTITIYLKIASTEFHKHGSGELPTSFFKDQGVIKRRIISILNSYGCDDIDVSMPTLKQGTNINNERFRYFDSNVVKVNFNISNAKI